MSNWMKKMMLIMLPYTMRFRMYLQGIARHSDADMANFSFDDLKAISRILGTKNFILTDDKPTSIDCTLFGHLAQFLYVPLEFPQKEFIRKECPNLAQFVDRVKDKLWPDWEEMCDPKCMVGKKSAMFM